MPRWIKKGVLELTKLEYPKKWYFPTYFANSVFGPNISTIDANGPFWPKINSNQCQSPALTFGSGPLNESAKLKAYSNFTDGDSPTSMLHALFFAN